MNLNNFVTVRYVHVCECRKIITIADFKYFEKRYEAYVSILVNKISDFQTQLARMFLHLFDQTASEVFRDSIKGAEPTESAIWSKVWSYWKKLKSLNFLRLVICQPGINSWRVFSPFDVCLLAK